jgi:hypothetical protein
MIFFDSVPYYNICSTDYYASKTVLRILVGQEMRSEGFIVDGIFLRVPDFPLFSVFPPFHGNRS